jgi:hypothetical protein
MKMYGEMAVQVDIFLTSALVVGEWSASCPCHDGGTRNFVTYGIAYMSHIFVKLVDSKV